MRGAGHSENSGAFSDLQPASAASTLGTRLSEFHSALECEAQRGWDFAKIIQPLRVGPSS